MRKIIRNQELVDDSWKYLADNDLAEAGSDVVVTLARFKREQDDLLAREGGLGVRIEAGEGIADLVPVLGKIALVCLVFPAFHDGRGLSYARELRERHRYAGEIRAVGDVQRDQVFGMHRCGINAFDVVEGKSIADALLGFKDFTGGYQADVYETRPIYRR